MALLAAAAALAAAAPAAEGFGHHGPSSITGTVPDGGSLNVSSPTLPPNARTASITAEPADAGSAKFFGKLQKILAAGRNPRSRLITCVILYALATDAIPNDTVSFRGTDPSLAFLLLGACLEMARAINSAPPAARAAAAGCPRNDLGAPGTITRTGRRYRLTVNATTRRASAAVRVTCRPRGRGVQIRLRTRSRRQTLRQVVGPKLGISYLNPATGHSVKIRTTFGD